jgi:hypothetical protein
MQKCPQEAAKNERSLEDCIRNPRRTDSSPLRAALGKHFSSYRGLLEPASTASKQLQMPLLQPSEMVVDSGKIPEGVL